MQDEFILDNWYHSVFVYWLCLSTVTIQKTYESAQFEKNFVLRHFTKFYIGFLFFTIYDHESKIIPTNHIMEKSKELNAFDIIYFSTIFVLIRAISGFFFATDYTDLH